MPSKVNVEIESLTTHLATRAKAKRVLCLDPARRTGWSLLIDGQVADSGVFELYREGTKKKYRESERFLALYNFMAQMLLDVKYDAVAFEQSTMAMKGRQALLSPGYRATVIFFSERHMMPCIPLAITTVKKVAVGNGRAKKEDVIAAMRERGHVPFDDNEADALAISYTILNFALDKKVKWEQIEPNTEQRETKSDENDRTDRASGKRQERSRKVSAAKVGIRKPTVRRASKKDVGAAGRSSRKPIRKTKRAATGTVRGGKRQTSNAKPRRLGATQLDLFEKHMGDDVVSRGSKKGKGGGRRRKVS